MQTKPSDAAFSGVFRTLKNAAEAAGDVISGVALDYVARMCFGDSRLNGGQIIRLFAWPDPFCAFLCSI